MFKAWTAQRVITLLLLVALPAVAGVRLSLDANTAFDSTPRVGAEHNDCSFKAHDHRLCVLSANAPLSLAPTCPEPTAPPPVLSALLDADEGDRGRDRLQSGIARAPPSRA